MVALATLAPSNAFVMPTTSSLRHQSSLLVVTNAKKSSSAGKGFGQAPAPTEKKKKTTDAVDSSASQPLTSAQGASDAIPTMAEVSSPAKASITTDPNLPPEERAKQVLREQYGLKTLEEQQTDAKKREAMAAARAQRDEWKKAAEQQKDFDLIAMIPGPVQIFIDRFLKLGVGICTLLFISAGIGITAEAWSKASNNPLPEDIDNFIVNVVEPNFTPGLLVLLAFSVSLGGFAALQLGSAGAQYKEDK